MPPAPYRNLLLRSNRYLGAALVETDLVGIPELETATERLLEAAAAGQPRRCNVLGILAYDLKVLKEEDVLLHLVEEHAAGLVDLRDVELADDLKQTLASAIKRNRARKDVEPIAPGRSRQRERAAAGSGNRRSARHAQTGGVRRWARAARD